MIRSCRRGAISRAARSTVRSSACAWQCGRARASRDRCCSAPTSTNTARLPRISRGSASGATSSLDRVIIDKNARIGDGVRLVNEHNLESADGEGYYIRSGIIVVPKGGVIRPGTVV